MKRTYESRQRQSKVKEHVFFPVGKLQEDNLVKRRRVSHWDTARLGRLLSRWHPLYLALARALSAALARGTALQNVEEHQPWGLPDATRQTPNIAPSISRQ